MKNNSVVKILFVILNFSTLWSQNLPLPKLEFTTQNGLCLELNGYFEKYHLGGNEFFVGDFSVKECETSRIFMGFDEMDKIAIKIMDSCVVFEFLGSFYDPRSKEYSDFRGYRTIEICKGNDATVTIFEKYHFDLRPVSETESRLFLKNLDEIFEVDSLLLNSVNGYGFVDMLFYCAIAGDIKAEYYFSSILEILKKRNLLSEYGGEPAQIYKTLKLIYDNR